MRILLEDTIAVVIDIQERLLPHINMSDEVVANTRILLDGLNALNVEVLVTEQYRKGLGETVAPIVEKLGDYHPMEKIAFSCCDDQSFLEVLNNSGKKNVILCGIESHVCVLQTCVDLIESGYQPVLVRDCTSSRKESDMLVALERMQQEGAIITTYESLLFELARVSGTAQFKMISKLVK